MFIQEYRASKILFNFLKSNNIKGTFLMPSNVCAVIPLVFYSANIDFEFVDIQNDNLCINQQEVLIKSSQYAGVIFVRTYGIESDFDSFFRSLKKRNPEFIIIDDSCLCLPDIKYIPSENVDLKLYSLGYAKQVDLKIGAYGFLNNSYSYKKHITQFNDSDYNLYQTELKNALHSNMIFVPENYYFLENKEYEINIDELSEQIGQVTAHKERLNSIYKNELPADIQLNSEFQHWRFNILLNENRKLTVLESLFSEKLFASSHYVPLSHTWKGTASPNALELSNNIVNLFNDFYYTEKQVIATCKIINNNL